MKNAHQLFNLMRRVEGLSLDIFDTALHRSFQHPVDVFLKVRNELLHSSLALEYPLLVSDFPILRQRTEQSARERYFREFGTPEIALDDIYAELANILGVKPDAVEAIKHLEVQEELRACYANPTILALYKEARSLGKPIVFCSDMYLPSTVLREMLRGAGFSADEPILVSGEVKRSKHEGTLFADVERILGIPPTRILHVGDNYHADVLMARRYGLIAWHFTEREEALQKLPNTEENQDYVSLTANRTIRGLVAKSFIISSFRKDEQLKRLGYEVFGPLFTGFFLWLLGHLHKKRPDKLLFFARDAFPFYRLFEDMKTELGFEIPCEYIYASRASLLLPSFTDLSFHRLWYLIRGRVPRSTREQLEHLGFSPELFEGAAKRVGLTLDEVIRGGDHRIYSLLVHEFHVLLRVAKGNQSLVKRYFEEVIGEAKNVAVVDIGWMGSLQSSLIRLLAGRDITTDGYYFGLFASAAANYMPGHTMNGWLVYNSQPDHWRAALESGGVELLELALVAPHSTTLGYKEVNGKVEPILENINNNQEELYYLAVAAQIQEGALAFVKEALRTLSVTPSKAESLATSQWATPFLRLIVSPTREEAELLSNITHCDAPTDTRVRTSLATKLPLWSRLNPRAYKKAREKAFWKAGFDQLNRFW